MREVAIIYVQIVRRNGLNCLWVSYGVRGVTAANSRR